MIRFGKSCPLENFAKRFMTSEVPKMKCKYCGCWRDEKCHYDDDMLEYLTKIYLTFLNLSSFIAKELRKESVISKKMTKIISEAELAPHVFGINASDARKQIDYWRILKVYDNELLQAKPPEREKIGQHIANWQQLVLNDGLSPMEAYWQIEEPD